MDPHLATVQSARTYRRIATVFLLLTVIVVSLASYVIFSRAEVTILSEPQEVTGDFLIDVVRGAGAGEVPGDVFELSDTASATFPSASVVTVDQPAEGRVRIVSKLYRAQTLVATTRLLAADGRLYRLRKTVVIPGNGTLETDAYADKVGTEGEIAAGEKLSIPGLNAETGRFFEVSTVAAFMGGKKEVHMVTQADVDKAAEVLQGKIRDSLGARMRITADEVLGQGDRSESVSVTETARRIDNPVGSDAAQFTLAIDANATGVFYDRAAFTAVLRAKLSDKLFEERTLTTVDAASVKVSVEKRDLVAGRANLRVTASGTSAMSANTPALDPAKLAGISVTSAVDYLQSIDGVASASIKVSPFWAGRMPTVPEHIKIEIR